MVFDAPAKELHWKDHDRAQLSVAPKALESAEQLRQELDQAGGASTRCMHLGTLMKVSFVPSGDNLRITLLEKPEKKDVLDYKSITWRWEIFANERGEHPLYLNVTGYVYSSLEGGRFRT